MPTIFSPYRINPLGAHVDHQGGVALSRTIDLGTRLSFAPLDVPEIHLRRTDMDEDFQSRVGAAPHASHWGRYAQAAALALKRIRPLRYGFSGEVNGQLPSAGLSSSTSVSLTYLMALAVSNEIDLTPSQMVELARVIENDYLGLQVSLLDPVTITFGTSSAFLFMDFSENTMAPIHDPATVEETAWLIVYSGIPRELNHNNLNLRVKESRKAARILDPKASRLGDVSPEKFIANRDKLSEPLQQRATHYFTECDRVIEGGDKWKDGDFAAFGALMNASCESTIHLYESGIPILVDLHLIVRAAPGVYGSRFSGGGYGGCVIALVDIHRASEAMNYIQAIYQEKYPELAGDASIYLAQPASGLQGLVGGGPNISVAAGVWS